MASTKNDLLLGRTCEGSLNYYDNHKGCATAADKGLAARLGGHSYNIINNSDQHEIYFRDLRHDDHFVDKNGKHTAHFFGCRRRFFPQEQRNVIAETIKHPDAHPRERALAERRAELKLAQMENPTSFRGFQQRCQSSLITPDAPKRYPIHSRHANEAGQLQPKTSDRATWQGRRGEKMSFSSSAPSLSLSDPARSLDQAMRNDVRKEASQRQTESAHFAPVQTANSYSSSLDVTSQGKQQASQQRHFSMSRIDNHDFAITKKNNHFSGQDKLTKTDPYYARPRLCVTNNSVKYDIVSNERKWFRY
uniref:Uncharacterized protein n=1 Tax=Pyrodinium bahamense TaxID=73915 RepID=A0A7S0A2J9_9DINO|mmetsp:Transcript_20064/g.55233  ORF Transcript_20064/g.55233 Transcript_20064/m.55233 type:complete len:306 (+) Transcript_20064:84-1001(+)|eukprot:CAMPEP_0179081208 /NCGR_PEP_ID=MMETSP0796-20121207/36551_1 /TAXON_ID=73915 /ORGANISM="Pyrodinium bahamense, Strain pbaha01" /LENGTH=305 /DNA_ID=CAMNT_0020778591 /DNA_START=73 /DNA_END=990 /DNA_ORIENTATION=-